MIFKDVIQYVKSNIGLCGRTEEFMDKYLLNAVLSYIEEREQELILSMRYDEWLRIDKKSINEIRSKVIDHIDKFALACRGEALSEEEVRDLSSLLSDLVIIDALCKFYSDGIYDASYSRYIVIKDVPPNLCKNVLSTKLSLNIDIYIRSRFIDIAKDLYLVKRRFPDRSSFEAIPLVDRVFAYAEPRYIPLGKIKPSEAFIKIKEYIEKIYILYNKQILKRLPSNKEIQTILDILGSFFNKLKILFYEFQVEGIKRLLESIIIALSDGKTSINIIEAPTGSGKTEIFVLTTLILALIKRISLFFSGKIFLMHGNTPITILIYPRQALAANQIDRLLKYLYRLNKEIENKFKKEKNKPLVTLSINYGEVRRKYEYEDLVIKNLDELRSNIYIKEPKKTEKYRGRLKPALRFDELNNRVFVELKYFKCPSGDVPRLMYDLSSNTLIYDRVLCGKEELSYLKVVKDAIEENPGDIHVTLFETLRLNLLSSITWRNIFGNEELGGPLLFVLDEIHTYVGIRGARYAYALRRAMARIVRQTRRKGFVIVGVSATLPNPEEFVNDLFLIGHGVIDNVRPVFIRPKDAETIPLGNEYFFIVVPTTKYPTDFLSVSIQTVMTLFYNMPALPRTNGFAKKAFLFADDLNVVRRFRIDLSDAVKRKEPIGSCKDPEYGLQDLRNVMSSCFDQTINDYGDSQLAKRVNFRVEHLDSYKSWRNGELWWGYTLEYKELGIRFNDVTEYTSRFRGDITKPLVVTTSALEVGVDYEDVVLIYQHGMPPNLSALVQRAGRAGRRIFENPLIRTVVAVQLSPEVPTQATYFEIFTRVKSLREALRYDRLYVSTRNEHIIKQTITEAILDYLILYGLIRTSVDESNIKDFECNSFLNTLKRIWNSKSEKEDLLKYLKLIFPSKEEEIINHVVDVMSFVENECRRGS